MCMFRELVLLGEDPLLLGRGGRPVGKTPKQKNRGARMKVRSGGSLVRFLLSTYIAISLAFLIWRVMSRYVLKRSMFEEDRSDVISPISKLPLLVYFMFVLCTRFSLWLYVWGNTLCTLNFSSNRLMHEISSSRWLSQLSDELVEN